MPALSQAEVEVIETWKKLFPGKACPQARPGTALVAKLQTRMRSPEWADSVLDALDKASKTKCLHELGWFNFDWMVSKESTVTKMLAGWMDWKDQADEMERAKLSKACDRGAESRNQMEQVSDIAVAAFDTPVSEWETADGKQMLQMVRARALRTCGQDIARKVGSMLYNVERDYREALKRHHPRDRRDLYADATRHYGQRIAHLLRDAVEADIVDRVDIVDGEGS